MDNAKSELPSLVSVLRSRAKADIIAERYYSGICVKLSQMTAEDGETVDQFFNDNITDDVSDLLDDSCTQLVKCILNLNLNGLSRKVEERYENLLVNIAVKHVVHCSTVLNSLVKKLIPHCVRKEIDISLEDGGVGSSSSQLCPFDLSLTKQSQARVYEIVHRCIFMIVELLPVSSKTVLKGLERAWPHFKAPSLAYRHYLRNLLLVSEYLHEIRFPIWSLIVDNLLFLDALITRKEIKTCVNNNEMEKAVCVGLFAMDDDYINEETRLIKDKSVQIQRDKLDCCMADLFNFILCAHNLPVDDESGDWLPSTSVQTSLYTTLKEVFDEHMLLATDASIVPFIWFHICSLDQKNREDFLSQLWQYVSSPRQTMANAKKSEGAACFLASFLSRADYIPTEEAKCWMTVLVEWASEYVNEHLDRDIGDTGRHGPFYAVCQAIFLVFSFRYKQFMGPTGRQLSEINGWNLGHIVHSKFNPLCYVSWQVALCFASITRSLQLLYCANRLTAGRRTMLDEDGHRIEWLPFNSFFPFDPYYLPRSLNRIRPLYRLVCPLTETDLLLEEELRWNQQTTQLSKKDTIEDDDFLLSEDLTASRDIDMLTPFSKSPGFRFVEC